MLLEKAPFVRKKLQQVKYPDDKLNKIRWAVKRKILPEEQELSETDDEAEILKQLMDNFDKSSSRSEKVQTLTVLPKSWSIQGVQEEFGATYYMVRKAKELVKQKGILSTPNPKPGHELPEETVQASLNLKRLARQCQAKKRCCFCSSRKSKSSFPKEIGLKEAYQLFKDKFPTKSIGFSKFAELRPKHCILAGASGTHAVCVCTIHQNIKLMMVGAKIPDIILDSVALKTYDHCFAHIIWNPPSPDCYLSNCSSCPGIDQFREQLMNDMDNNLIDTVTYKEWVSVD